MVLEGGRSHPRGKIDDATQLGKTQDPLRRVTAHRRPFIFRKLSRFVQNLQWDSRFSHVMKERRQTEVGQFDFRVTRPIR